MFHFSFFVILFFISLFFLLLLFVFMFMNPNLASRATQSNQYRSEWIWNPNKNSQWIMKSNDEIKWWHRFPTQKSFQFFSNRAHLLNVNECDLVKIQCFIWHWYISIDARWVKGAMNRKREKNPHLKTMWKSELCWNDVKQRQVTATSTKEGEPRRKRQRQWERKRKPQWLQNDSLSVVNMRI